MSAISQHLMQLKLPFIVSFTYWPWECHGGERYPVLKMKWVDGFLLNEFVAANINNNRCSSKSLAKS